MNFLFWFFYLLDYVICSVLTFIFTWYYVNKNVSKFIVIFSRLVLFANFLLIFTLPYEIIYYNLKENYLNSKEIENIMIINELKNNSNTNKTDNNTNSDTKELKNVLLLNYEIIFWVLLTLSKQIIGYFINYVKCGEFTFWRKVFHIIKSTFKSMIIFGLLSGILGAIMQNIPASIFIIYYIVYISYAFIYLGITMVKLPRNMYIHSNNKLALEYYEFKSYKISKELNKNNEELKKLYLKCQKTLNYIQNIEEFVENEKNKKNKNQDKQNKEEKEELDEKDNYNNENFENEMNDVNNEEFNEMDKNEEEENNNKEEKESKDGLSKTDKDYKKHKSIIKYKKYINILYENLTEIIKKHNIEIDDNFNELPIKDYKKIVASNFKSKELDKDNERINAQIHKYYKNWAFIKEISTEKNNKLENDSFNDKDINSPLKDNDYIPSFNFSKKKIEFYKKYSRPLYLSLIFFL